ncbi:MAG TPA: DUF1428 domain-containing protein [Kofleriaceae bacterium]
MSNYIDGFVVPVKTTRKQEYVEMAAKMAKRWFEWGATNVVEAWGDDVPDGKATDFKRAVDAKPDETIVFSWVTWPSKAARDAGQKKMQEDPEMVAAMKDTKDPPFSMQRMIMGGFSSVVDETKH